MIFAICASVALFIIGILVFATNMGKMLPIGVRLLPFVSIAIVWVYAFSFSFQNGLSTILLIAFWVITGPVVIPLGIGILVFAAMDSEKFVPTETIGDPSRKEKICVVYHPGMSNFPITSIRTCALKLSEKGFSTTIACANKKLAVMLRNYKAIVFASPVYAGAVRPPLTNFIKRTNLSGTKSFILITGSVRASAIAEIEKTSKLVSAANGSVAGAIKVTTDETETDLRRELEGFAAEIASGI